MTTPQNPTPQPPVSDGMLTKHLLDCHPVAREFINSQIEEITALRAGQKEDADNIMALQKECMELRGEIDEGRVILRQNLDRDYDSRDTLHYMAAVLGNALHDSRAECEKLKAELRGASVAAMAVGEAMQSMPLMDKEKEKILKKLSQVCTKYADTNEAQANQLSSLKVECEKLNHRLDRTLLMPCSSQMTEENAALRAQNDGLQQKVFGIGNAIEEFMTILPISPYMMTHTFKQAYEKLKEVRQDALEPTKATPSQPAKAKGEA